VTGAVTVPSVWVTGAVTAESVWVTGAVTVPSVWVTGAVTAESVWVTGAVTVPTVCVTGAVWVTGAVTADCVLDTGAIAPEGVKVEGPDTAANVFVTGEVALPKAVPTVWVAAVATPVCVIGAATDVAVVVGWVEDPAVVFDDEVGAARALDEVGSAPDVVVVSAPMLEPALDGALGDAADPTRPVTPEESADDADEVLMPRAEARPEPKNTTKATTATIPNTTRASVRRARASNMSRLFCPCFSVRGFIDRFPQQVPRECQTNRSLRPAQHGANPARPRQKLIRSAHIWPRVIAMGV